MAWPKIKNIIILILLGTNICLLAFTVVRQARSHRLQDQARADAISFLQEKELQVEEDQVPRTMELMAQHVQRDVEQEYDLAAAVLGGQVSVEARGAGVYRYYNENGSIQFHSNGEFSAQFTAEGAAVKEEPASHAGAVLERLNFQGSLLDQQGDGEWMSLTFQEEWKGVPLLSCQATLNYEQGRLVSMSGRRLVGSPEQDSSSKPITVATALMKFYTGRLSGLGDVCSQITGITQAYTVTSTISETMSLIPVWCITTDTGTYQLDTLTGELSRTI